MVERSDKHIGGFVIGRLLPLSSLTSGGDNGGKNEHTTCAGLDALHAIKSYMDSLVTTYNQVNS
ncbi:hypothetical protein Lal_00042201 [Lupinus albus]|nr:hypothetical protein Lal_00042201 [Lupinus albus]